VNSYDAEEWFTLSAVWWHLTQSRTTSWGQVWTVMMQRSDLHWALSGGTSHKAGPHHGGKCEQLWCRGVVYLERCLVAPHTKQDHIMGASVNSYDAEEWFTLSAVWWHLTQSRTTSWERWLLRCMGNWRLREGMAR